MLSRSRSASHVPGGTPVVLADVDLFGHPATEVLEALGDDLPAELSIAPQDRHGYLTAVTLRATPPPPPPPPAGRRTRAAAEAAEVERALGGYQYLWTTERDRWQLHESGGGHVVQRRDAPWTHLLICNDTLARRITAEMLAAGVNVVPERF
ncbi:hypothetical protein ACIQOV_29635 [Kitasatospora sp. NPDC091257]|uniref:hypothetical protein n=1 Tax=Kitasatospora sp. NPDC091257 TaxID=3364084 RepID=UPI0037F75FB3